MALAVLPFPAAAQNDWLLYVGTYTRQQSKGIYAYGFQSATGKLAPLGLAGETSNPSFLAVHPSQRFLYAVNENDRFENETAGSISAFAINPANGQLKLLNQVSSKGAGPCHVAVDKTGKWLFAANYNGGSVAAYPINADGSLSKASAFFQHAGPPAAAGQNRAMPHAHMAAIPPDNRFVLAPDLGLDQVLSYRLDPSHGGMTPNDPPFTSLAPLTGPRHIVIRPDAKFAYVLGELASNVTVLAYDASRGSVQVMQTISLLPAGYTGNNSGAEIALAPSGNFLYASNRGHDSIAIFKVDAANGTLTTAGDVSTQGKTPRNFTIDPSGNYLLAANQDSGTIVEFRIDRQTGGLTPVGDAVQVDSPVCLTFVSTAAAAAH